MQYVPQLKAADIARRYNALQRLPGQSVYKYMLNVEGMEAEMRQNDFELPPEWLRAVILLQSMRLDDSGVRSVLTHAGNRYGEDQGGFEV